MTDIKLIVTDMDGTFLNSNYEISPEFPKVFEELKKRNIKFVPASGRQMAGITKYFENIEQEIGFIAENGGYVVYQNEEILADKMQHQHIVEIIKTVREISGARAVLSAKKYAYYETEDQNFVDFFTKYYIKNKKINDLTEMIDDTAFKIAIYHPEGSEKNLYPFLKHFEEFGLEVVVSGEFWMDIMNKNINKGKALSILQNELQITPDQTIVFGDYMNDIEMLQNAKYSFAMQNAHPSVKEKANFLAPSNNDFGVIEIIKEYLQKNQL